jgi:5-methyltetrahydropteroyltriglutamate--homocysteine methyltransferase
MSPDNRIPVTHVGSLIRPPALVQYLAAMEAGESVDDAGFQDCLQQSVIDVVQSQADHGVDIVSDGEFGKSHSWSRYVLDRLSGFELHEQESASKLKSGEVISAGNDRRQFPDFYADYDKSQGFSGLMGTWVCAGPITYSGGDELQRDITNLKAAMAKTGVADGFLPVVAPASVAPERRDEYYASDEEFVFAIAEAMAEEYAAIVDAGLYVQIDDAHLPFMYDRMVPPASLAEYRAWAGLRIDALNHALAGIPEDRVRYHICWGSFNSPHLGDVALADIVDLVLKVNAGAYAIEGANPRHAHEWRIWEDVKLPDGKTLIPGVVTHSTNIVEHPELVAERLAQFAGLVGAENLMAGTDCGFAQGPLVRRVHPSVQWAKLEALAEGAAIASGRLW